MYYDRYLQLFSKKLNTVYRFYMFDSNVIWMRNVDMKETPPIILIIGTNLPRIMTENNSN